MVLPITFESGASASMAKAKLLDWFTAWLGESTRSNTSIPWKGIHDEGTYLTSWREYFLHANDPSVKSYAMTMLEKSDAWLRRHLVHGYWPKQEVHHGVEHFIIFLAWIHELDPAEQIHARQLRGAAANILDTGSKRCRWFDLATNRFTSLYLGTRRVDPKKSLNIAEHLRLVRLAWLGLACGGDPGLADVIRAYSREWALQVMASADIPLYLGEFTEEDAAKRAAAREAFTRDAQAFVGAAPREITPTTRGEIHVANGTPGLFIALHEATGDTVYLDAAERIVGAVIGNLASPYAHPVGDLAWHLFRAGRLQDLPRIIIPIQQRIDMLAGKELDISLDRNVSWKQSPYFKTVGIRKDMPAVAITAHGSRGRVDLPSPATLGLLYRMTKNQGYLRLAIDFAQAVLDAAKPDYPDGREHGCNARALHAFCVGHGRNWGAGFASTALRAALGETTGEIPLPRMKL
jgi:hypothetical protein